MISTTWEIVACAALVSFCRIRCRIGFSRMDKIVKERMTTNDSDNHYAARLDQYPTGGDGNPVNSSVLLRFHSLWIRHNPLAELTHKRRLSALGPGGLSRDRASV